MKEKFWLVHRFNIKNNDQQTHSTQYFNNYDQARQRYYNIIASDLNDETIIYNSVEIVDAYGRQIASDYFDRYKPEPKPEQTATE